MAIVFQSMSGQEEAEAFIAEETKATKQEGDYATGDALYVVSNKWFTQWCQYSGFTYDPAKRKPRVVPQSQPGPRPGPIDNSDLLAPHPSQSDLTPEQAAGVHTLREGLCDKKDFWLVQEVTWSMLKDWYKVAGPEIRREYHLAGRRCQLDVHQQHYRVVLPEQGQGTAGERDCVVGASVHCQLAELKAMACQQLGLQPEQYDIHDYRACQQGASLESTSYKTLTGNKLADQQALLLLPRAAAAPVLALPAPGGAAAAAAAASGGSGSGGGSPSGPMLILGSSGPAPIATSPIRTYNLSSPRYSSPMSPLSRSFDRAPGWAEDVVYTSEGRGHGLAGLGNLGNTCFMNSSLQCLAHSWPLMQTFLSGDYKRDLNRDNPLSLGGKLALAFACLMDKLWRGGVGHVSPKLFKWQLAKFAPQFSGYAQQDSQELLAFLLDGLHEDLNRITDKPYIEDKDSDGRPDEEVAAEAWHNYRRRNDSVIVDSFQYLCRSKLTCPQCAFQSVKFDPLMYLTLPLPSSKKRTLTFTVVHVDGSAPPRQYGIELPKSATIGQLYGGIAELAGVASEAAPAEQVLLLTQFNMNNGEVAVYDDLKARVSALEDFRSRTSFFLSRSSPPSSLYLAWVYPSPQQGPRSGRQLVQVFHKSRGSFVLPATPLFIERKDLEALSTEEAGADTVVQPGGGRDAIDAALRAVLRPLCKHPPEEELAPEPAAPAAAHGAAGAGAGSSSSMSVDGGAQQQQQEQQGAAPADGPTPMDEAAPSADAGGAAAEAAAAGQSMGAEGEGEGEAMEVEAPQQAQQQQQQQQPGGMPNGDEAWLGGMGAAAAGGEAAAAAAAPAAADGDTFDMWAAQKEDQARAAAEAAAAAAAAPLYVLKTCRPSYGSLSTYKVKLEVPDEAGQPLLLLAEWQDAAAQLYDPAPLAASPDRHPSAVALAERAKGGGKGVTLEDCLETFLEEEQLGADESWYCKECKAHVQADKKLDLWSLPDVLVILLQRFSHSRYSRDKLDTLVDFPLEGLDMAPYVLDRQQQQNGAAPPAKYDLYAVSNHYGSMGGGHYTAYCRLPGGSGAEQGWHSFDDSHVSPMEAGGVKTKAAYVLFYKRQGAEVDLNTLLEQHRMQQQQEAGSGGSGEPLQLLGSGSPQVGGQQQHQQLAGGAMLASPQAQQQGLGKRQPETIDEELEEGDAELADAELADADVATVGELEID